MDGTRPRPRIAAINGGSSTIKFALYECEPTRDLVSLLRGRIDRVGLEGTSLTFDDLAHSRRGDLPLVSSGYGAAAEALIDWLESEDAFTSIRGIGHRVVHGVDLFEPELVTPELLAQLDRAAPYAPDHLPPQIELIEAFERRHPRLAQVACFDTAFHHTLPRVARLLPIPRRYQAKGVRRYGFHGLSYAYLMEELARLAGAEAANGRVILAHLGNGASLAAVREGRSLDTTMGFTPAAGLVMSTRSGDLDPGLVAFFARQERMDASEFDRMVNQESGLLGISETASDMRDLLECRDRDPRAAEAVALFCYRAKQWIGAYAAILGGLDTLVFAGGIGENAPPVRWDICEGLGFLGIELDRSRNGRSVAVVSADKSRVTVRAMHTDEEQMIARSTCRVLGLVT